MTVRFPVIGVEMHCPDCGRLLVTYNGDGTANLAPKSEAKWMAQEWLDDDGFVRPPTEAVVMEAICHLRPCRLKRKVRNIRNRARRN